MRDFGSISGWRERRIAIFAAALTCAGIGGAIVTSAKAADDRSTLRTVTLAFRHDVISPKYSPPKLGATWPMGMMQLTAVGIQHTYHSGLQLRRKYVDELALISGKYKMGEVFVRASNTDRALQSAQVLMLGLYPLGNGPDPAVFNKNMQAIPAPNLAYTPVPVHAVSLDNDNVMRPWTGQASCKKYRRFVKSLSDTKVYQAQARRFSSFLQRVAHATGYNDGKSSVKILYEINEIYEPLTAIAAHNMKFPKSISQKDMELLRLLSDWNYHYQFLGRKVGRLTGGSFIAEVLKNFDAYMKNPAKARKLSVYSGHQRTILGIEAALGIEKVRVSGEFFKGRVPPLGSHYAFELHEPSKGSFAVRVKFVSGNEEKSIRIPGCDSDMCPISQFKAATADVVPENWRAECGA